jgi:hypothetical protein
MVLKVSRPIFSKVMGKYNKPNTLISILAKLVLETTNYTRGLPISLLIYLDILLLKLTRKII